MDRTYGGAIAALNSLQTNFSIINAMRQSGRVLNEQSIPETIEWCRKIGHKPSDLDRLNLIHIAGTKGKGSTCAFISSILSQYLTPGGEEANSTSKSTPKFRKIGLYTSPHLRFVRERIQINNAPLTESQFTQYFFEVWDLLEEDARSKGLDPKAPNMKPNYFRYLTIMAFHTYLKENVDAAIIECGIGGEYDTTNILVNPVVEGITSLGIDHVAMLGSTIEEIAWHKAGIMKPGTVAYTAQQPEPAMGVLQKRAEEKKAQLYVAQGHPDLVPGKIRLGLSGEFQNKNAELAVAICSSFLRKIEFPDVPSYADKAPLPEKFKAGLEGVKLGGRCEIRKEDDLVWHIDGGHTADSIEVAGKWFSGLPYTQTSTAEGHRKPCILIFNQQTRDITTLANTLHKALTAGNCTFTHAIFCTNVTFKEAGYRPDLVSINTDASDVEKLSVQNKLAEVWRGLSPDTKVEVKATIEEAVESARSIAALDRQEHSSSGDSAVSVLATGSLHLIGGLLEVLETATKSK
ncbi:folylpolyglutamate synthase [Arthroderma uncinatum]|uniref:folylpolyglutamate synthase n=1 Tax=Arthroderma uncinatum TaxID=74035 RepID=UPI00144A6A9A|nr:folylpolyglutamate synthase [Arthroderma uncinatum]KAF3483968.1 folylpolyglutamate synthase [Arthroderma uncinatum]